MKEPKPKKPPRLQCSKCPWKVSADPREIPGGYCETKHKNLKDTIAEPGSLAGFGTLRIMACHETTKRGELPCVGWLVYQMEDGNNIPLRMAVMLGHIDANVKIVGPQHESFEDTLPKDRD